MRQDLRDINFGVLQKVLQAKAHSITPKYLVRFQPTYDDEIILGWL